MTAIAALLDKLFPYIVALIVGMALGVWARAVADVKVLAAEKVAHAQDNAKNAKVIADMNAAAVQAEQKAIADHTVAEGKIATLDDQLTQEKAQHEADNRKYAAALAAGTARLRIRVAHCSSSPDDVPAAAPASGVDDGTAAYADVDGQTASRVFGVASDDDSEIEKLKGLQAYVCAIQPGLPACQH